MKCSGVSGSALPPRSGNPDLGHPAFHHRFEFDQIPEKQPQILRSPTPTTKICRWGPRPLRMTSCLFDVSLRTEAAHAADERGRSADGEVDEVAFVVARMDDHARFNGGEHCAFVLRDTKISVDDGIGVERIINGNKQKRECLRR